MPDDSRIRPYAAVGNVKDLLRRYRNRNLPDTMTQDTLRVAGVPEGMISRTVAAFRFLGLLNEANEPTDEWRALNDMDDSNYPDMLARILRAAYAETFAEIDPTTDPQPRIRSHFQKYQPKSQIDRMVTLFLALCAEAGIPTLDTPKQRVTKNQQTEEARGRRVGVVSKRPLPPTLPAPFIAPTAGESKVITLYGGGTLSLHASVRFFELPKEDREFVFKLLDQFSDYENRKLIAAPTSMPQIEAATA
ncbi:MAG: DUF5343 domain-containing protein [Chloroflexi bacterium]|nr:DUF5343 domain-containing protein [Chloroflexota bacterium]